MRLQSFWRFTSSYLVSHSIAIRVAVRTIFAVLLIMTLAMRSHADTRLPGNDTRTEELVITYPHPSGDQAYDNRINYFIELLELAIKTAGRPCRLAAYQVPMTTAGRSRQNIQQGHYDVAWMHTSVDLERTLQPVRVPLLKGLIGWRLFFIREQDTEKFAHIKTLQELSKQIAGQGYDYPDNIILEASHLALRTGLHRNNVLQMLLKNRVDYFPRSITEIYDEWRVFGEPGLAIERSLALKYPSAFYFFVAKDNVELAELLNRGLQKAIISGEFDKVFNRYFGDIIARSNLSSRTILSIPHPTLSATIPLEKPEYWFDPVSIGRR